MAKRTEHQPLIKRNPASFALNRVGQFFQSHRRPINVAVDCASTLAPFQLANNMLQGWPETYNENLIKLNFAFAGYFILQLLNSIGFHHQNNEEENGSLLLSTTALLLFTLTVMCYITDSLQDNLIAGIAQETNPEGGANSVSPETFWSIDFAIPVTIALAYSASQFGKGMHSLLTKNRPQHLLNPAPLRIPPTIKTAFKITDKVATFGVEALAVYGSLFQDMAYYSLSYAGVNLMDYPQYATTALYGSGAAMGVIVAGLFEAGVLPKLISKQQFEKVVVAAGSALGLSVFYTSNIAETRQNGVNVATMLTMIGVPALMLAGAGVYAATHFLCGPKKEPVRIEPVAEESLSLSSSSSTEDSPMVDAEHAHVYVDAEAQNEEPVIDLDAEVAAHSSSSSEDAELPVVVVQASDPISIASVSKVGMYRSASYPNTSTAEPFLSAANSF